MYSNFSQFGLYRYDNGGARDGSRGQRNFHSKIIVCSILTMTCIFCALMYVFVASRFVEPAKAPKLPALKPKDSKVNRGIEVVEISGKNVSEAPRRIKRLDSDESDRSPDSQKLVFLPGRDLKPPRIMEKPRVINFPPVPYNHKVSSRMADPRPFNHMSGGPRPNSFRPAAITTARSFNNQVNNIRDVIQQNQLPMRPKQPRRLPMAPARFNAIESSSMHPVQLAGTYRHPRKNGELSKMFQPDGSQKQQPEMLPDPFHNYKPNSPLEINQMAVNGMNGMRMMAAEQTQNPYFRRKFRHQVASIPNYNIRSKDAAGIYQNVLHTSGKKFQVDRTESAKAKPFSVMLDVYPMAGEEGEMNQMQQMQHQMQMMPQQQQPQRVPRMKPFQGYYQDPSYFNSMPFPQLLPRYPAHFRYLQPQPESSNIHQVGMIKPSQLVVHLNLYPKNKAPFKRSSMEEQIEAKKQEMPRAEPTRNATLETSSLPFNINFNVNTGNGHPENIHHHVSLPRDPYHNFTVSSEPTYKPNYYYDENDEDQGIVVAPSLVYNNIHRDRPVHMMLRNSTMTQQTVKQQKGKQQPATNHKLTYQTIERPRKTQIKNEPRHLEESRE